MSQLSSFVRLRLTDVPHRGFWSKPKPRLFRKPESRFDEFLRRHEVASRTYDRAGVEVALLGSS